MFKKENLPNLLTLARIILIPIFLLMTSLASSNIMHILRRLSLLLPVLQIIWMAIWHENGMLLLISGNLQIH